MRTALLLAVALPVALVAGTASQLDYPACAINHAPEYYCCDLGAPEGSDVSNGLVYVRYNRPQGDGFTSEYAEGWEKSRQVNYDPDGDVIMLDDGTVNATAQSLCTSASGVPVYRFNSFTETPLVVVYAI
eukprot:jgi/Phyca11/112394/e_gw1.22.636.1